MLKFLKDVASFQPVIVVVFSVVFMYLVEEHAMCRTEYQQLCKVNSVGPSNVFFMNEK